MAWLKRYRSSRTVLIIYCARRNKRVSCMEASLYLQKNRPTDENGCKERSSTSDVPVINFWRLSLLYKSQIGNTDKRHVMRKLKETVTVNGN